MSRKPRYKPTGKNLQITLELLEHAAVRLRLKENGAVCGALTDALTATSSLNSVTNRKRLNVCQRLIEHIEAVLGRESAYVTDWLEDHSPEFVAFNERCATNHEARAAFRAYRILWIEDMIRTLKNGGAL